MLSSKKRKCHTRQQPSAILASWGFQTSSFKNLSFCEEEQTDVSVPHTDKWNWAIWPIIVWAFVKLCYDKRSRANQYCSGTVFSLLCWFLVFWLTPVLSRLAKNLAVCKRFGNFFRLGVIPILPTHIFLLKQTNKGVESLRPNTEYSCALNFLLCFVHYVQLDKSTSSELVREWLRWANIIFVFIFMWSHGPTFVAERQSK